MEYLLLIAYIVVQLTIIGHFKGWFDKKYKPYVNKCDDCLEEDKRMCFDFCGVGKSNNERGE